MAGLRSIRFRLLVAVNVAMALLLLVFLVADYYREIAERVAQTHIALEGEARTLLPAVLRLRPQGTRAVQEYVDTVCGQMQDSTSPGHHIGARLGDFVLQATAVINLVFLRMAAKPLERLVETVRQIARGQLGVQAGPFKAAELEYLAGEINSMSSSLAEIDRHRRHEMEKARRIQDHLLPGEISLPGLAVGHLYQPATEVAGDYYDMVGVSDGSWLLCIADVSGHGVPAAMSAAMLKTLLMHAADRHVAPAQILRFINDRFAAVSLDGDFATMMLARWLPEGASHNCGSKAPPFPRTDP